MPIWGCVLIGAGAALVATAGVGFLVACELAAAMDDYRPSHLD